MCELLSISVDREGDIYVILGEARRKAIRKGINPDSHSYIAEYWNKDEDQMWKFEMPVEGEVPHSPGQLIDVLHYDGGLPEEDIPLSVFKHIGEWLKENWENIQKNIRNTLGNANWFLEDIETNSVYTVDDEIRWWIEKAKEYPKGYLKKLGENERVRVIFKSNGVDDYEDVFIVKYNHMIAKDGEIVKEVRVVIYPIAD